MSAQRKMALASAPRFQRPIQRACVKEEKSTNFQSEEISLYKTKWTVLTLWEIAEKSQFFFRESICGSNMWLYKYIQCESWLMEIRFSKLR